MKLTLLIILLTTSNALFGCFGEVSTLENADWASLDEVFTGKVIKVERKLIDINSAFEEMITLVGFETTFEVDKKWKGSNSNIVKIIQSGSSCSKFFYIDDFKYFITAKRRKFNNNVKEDTKNTIYLTTEYSNLTISQRRQDSLYNAALDLMDSIHIQPLELKSHRTHELLNNDKEKSSALILILSGFFIGSLFMYLILRKI